MNDLATQADRLEAAVAAILALRPRLEAGAPWPLAELYGTEAEASWGPPELLAHLDEMLPFWLGEVERILDGPTTARLDGPAAAGLAADNAVPYGRLATDTLRNDIIGRDRTVPIRELLARLASDGARVARWMRELSASDAARLGVHPTRGESTIAAIFERSVTGHLEDHVLQLRSILDAAGT